MLNSQTQDLNLSCEQFLEQTPQQRLLLLKELGLARYADFLTKMPLTPSNIACVARFFCEPSRVKFPNLKNADLSGLNLNGVNFIRADLSGANLKGSSLLEADLLFANFTAADLRDADLRGATLNQTIWSNALVDKANFSDCIGLSNQQHQYLKIRGARFSHD